MIELEQIIEQARTAVEEILAVLQVHRVVCVDDKYLDEPSIEDVIVAALSLDGPTLLKVIPELGGSVTDDPDILKAQIRRWYNGLDSESEDRSQRIKSLMVAERIRNNAERDDFGDVSILRELIPKGILVELSPKKWEECRDHLLQEDPQKRTLFLFDQDLSEGGGDPDGGIKIISSLLTGSDNENVICGLLTATVTPENQIKSWAALSQTYTIPQDRFMVLPKQQLSKDPVLIAQTLKWIALLPDFTKLKQETARIIKEAYANAASHIDAIRIHDLDQMVFKISAEEGLWEPDMLFRLHALFHRLESRRLAHDGGTLEAIASRLRSVSHIPTKTEYRIESSSWKIQQDELYEQAYHLNRNYLPLELGDIFSKTGTTSKKYYILLAQPCDLMVRNDGKRYPEVDHVPLVEVALGSSPPQCAEEMAYFGNGPDEFWYVKFKQVHQVRLCVLDLCIFNNDGSAAMVLDQEPPVAIRPAWKARYKILGKLASVAFRK